MKLDVPIRSELEAMISALREAGEEAAERVRRMTDDAVKSLEEREKLLGDLSSDENAAKALAALLGTAATLYAKEFVLGGGDERDIWTGRSGGGIVSQPLELRFVAANYVVAMDDQPYHSAAARRLDPGRYRAVLILTKLG